MLKIICYPSLRSHVAVSCKAMLVLCTSLSGYKTWHARLHMFNQFTESVTKLVPLVIQIQYSKYIFKNLLLLFKDI